MEILLAAMERVQIAAVILFVLNAAVMLGRLCNESYNIDFGDSDEIRKKKNDEYVKHRRRVFLLQSPIAVFLGLVLLVPDADDVVKMRITLIKYHLASPENVGKATETIERIGKKLECKYLGCEEKK